MVYMAMCQYVPLFGLLGAIQIIRNCHLVISHNKNYLLCVQTSLSFLKRNCQSLVMIIEPLEIISCITLRISDSVLQ